MRETRGHGKKLKKDNQINTTWKIHTQLGKLDKYTQRHKDTDTGAEKKEGGPNKNLQTNEWKGCSRQQRAVTER